MVKHKCTEISLYSQEEWRPIPGSPGYEVSSFGRIKSLGRNIDCGRAGIRLQKERILKQNPQSGGYMQVSIGKGFTRLVHIIVCTVFHGQKLTPEHEVMFLKNDKTNCRADNLVWATPTENKAHFIEQGRQAYGERSHLAKFTEADVVEIRRLYAAGTPSTLIERQYNISHSHVWQIATGEAWAHIAYQTNGGRTTPEPGQKIRPTGMMPLPSSDEPEEWRPIKDQPGYEVSDLGRVRSVDRIHTKTDNVPNLYKGRVLAVYVDKITGRPYVGLTDGVKHPIHVLVCETFHGLKPSSKHEAAHWDGKKENNKKDNLRWATRLENMSDDFRLNGKHRSAKLEAEDVRQMRKLRSEGVTLDVLSKQFGVSRISVWSICTRRSWQHLD